MVGIVKNKALVGPEKIEIILNTYCNMNCIFCWFHSPLIKRRLKKWKLEFDKFQEIIQSAQAMKTNYIYLSGWGEPTLHPDLPKMIKLARKKRFYITLTTNLAFNSKKMLNAVSMANQIEVTLCYASPKEYKKFQCPNSKNYFNMVIKNIHSLQNSIKHSNKKLILNFIINKTNYKSIDKLIDFAEKLGINYVRLSGFAYVSETSPLKISDKTKKQILNKLSDLHKKTKLNLQSSLELMQPLKLDKCYMGWFLMLIDAYGKVRVGCFDPSAPTIAGNIYKNSIEKIWFSKKADTIRSYLKNSLKRRFHCPFYFRNVKITRILEQRNITRLVYKYNT